MTSIPPSIKFLHPFAYQIAVSDANKNTNANLCDTMSTVTKSTATTDTAVSESSFTPSSSSEKGAATMAKKERRLAMNRMSARLRRKRQREAVDKMQNTMHDLEMSNKRLKSDNDELKRAIAELTKLCAKSTGSACATFSSNEKIAQQEHEEPLEEYNARKSVEDARYTELVTSALAKYNENVATEAAKKAVTTAFLPQQQQQQQQQQLQKPLISASAASILFNATRIDLTAELSSNALGTVLVRNYLINRQAAASTCGLNDLALITIPPFLPLPPSATKSLEEALAAEQLKRLKAMAFCG